MRLMNQRETIETVAKSQKYYKGRKNTLIRYYFYVQRGLTLLNEFRYLLMGILAIYYMLKLDNPVVMVIMFLVSVPALCIIGWLSVHHIEKVVEYLRIRFATIWSKYGYELNEDRNKLLKEIKEKL
jgi:hypothetical protein